MERWFKKDAILAGNRLPTWYPIESQKDTGHQKLRIPN